MHSSNYWQSGTLYSALTGGLICAWNTGTKTSEWSYSHALQGGQGDIISLVFLDPKSLCAASSTGSVKCLFTVYSCNNWSSYVYRFDATTQLALTRWKIGSIVDLVLAGSSLLCLTPSAVVFFKPETGEGSLSYFEGTTKGRKSTVRGGVGTFYFMSRGQGGADVGVYEIELKGGAPQGQGSAAVARKISQVKKR
jgi:hypothetical protein